MLFRSDGSFAVVSTTKSDLIIPQTNPPKIVPVKAVTKVAEAPLPKASTQPKKVSNHSDTWNIQIGAFPSKKGATGRLANATEKARKNLRGKVAFTIEVNKNGSKFYRARFAGFNRKTAARACRTLSRKGFGCFALAPRS